MSQPLPMWIVFPELSADEVHNQGAVEAYVELEWLPFWQGLTDEEKATYLDRHAASRQWRAAIAERYDWADFDIDEDADDSEAWAKRGE